MIDLRLGDCLEVMKSLPGQSIDLTVTSPPYDNLRTYNGYSFDFEGVAKELHRVTKDGGVIVWIVGDATINGSETGTSFRQALYFKEIGFNLHDTMIFKKSNPIPQIYRKRYNNEFEYMFVFSKGLVKTHNPIMISCLHAGQKMGNSKYKNFSKKEQIRTKLANPIKDKKIKSNIWEYAVGQNKESKEHPAPFPIQLAYDHVISWSNEGDTVLDCFLGSGTTGKVAKQLNRRFIGIEISPEYLEIAKNRINE